MNKKGWTEMAALAVTFIFGGLAVFFIINNWDTVPTTVAKGIPSCDSDIATERYFAALQNSTGYVDPSTICSCLEPTVPSGNPVNGVYCLTASDCVGQWEIFETGECVDECPSNYYAEEVFDLPRRGTCYPTGPYNCDWIIIDSGVIGKVELQNVNTEKIISCLPFGSPDNTAECEEALECSLRVYE